MIDKERADQIVCWHVGLTPDGRVNGRVGKCPDCNALEEYLTHVAAQPPKEYPPLFPELKENAV